jgi:1-deoxy-D-xylulose-5-phosphate reductoisomerase
LSANTRIDKLAKQIEKYSPSAVVIQDKAAFSKFNEKYKFDNLEVLSGRDGLIELAGRENYNFLVNALVGFSGLEPTLAAVSSGKDVALANKETLVIAGRLIVELTNLHKTKIFPIDSEHSAILQCMIGEDTASVSKLILTASGGPFLTKSNSEIRNSSVQSALAHPNWKMGKKITIDSATMMNKGLEVIEAKWLFDIDVNDIEVLIHPESIIHSMVEFTDGSVKAQMGVPDMKIPIQYSLTYPERVQSDFPRMDFKRISVLRFEQPDLVKFRCLQLAYDVLEKEGTYPAVLNSANEAAVDLFLNEKIQFYQIPELIESQLESHNSKNNFKISDVIEIDADIRKRLFEIYG